MIGHFLEWLVTVFLARVFPGRYRVIPRAQDGIPMLRQFKLTRWAYLQSFQCREVPERFHVHRWRRMFSFVLSGKFFEERYPGGITIRHEAPSIYSMDDTVIHHVISVVPRTWTLFLMFGKNRHYFPGGWGYVDAPDVFSLGYKSWTEEIPAELRVKSL